jgi:hypothetical protein
MGLVDKALWENRHADPAAIEAELAGLKGRGWLMRWLPARAHDNEIHTGVLSVQICFRSESTMILDPYGRILADTWKAGDDMIVADLDASLLKVSTDRRWIKTRRPVLYEPWTVPTGFEQDTRTVRFDKRGV